MNNEHANIGVEERAVCMERAAIFICWTAGVAPAKVISCANEGVLM